MSSILVPCVRVSEFAKYARKYPKGDPGTRLTRMSRRNYSRWRSPVSFESRRESVGQRRPGLPQRRRGVSRCGLGEDEVGETLRGTQEIFIDHVACHATQAVDTGSHVGRLDTHEHAKVSGPSDDARSLDEVFCRMTWSAGLPVNRPTRQVERIKVLVAAWVSPLGDQPPALEANHRSAHPRRFHVVAQPMV